MPLQQIYVVHPDDEPAMLVRAQSWLQAFGEAVHRRGHTGALTRLACEAQPDGSTVVLDAIHGRRYTIRVV